jgi:hypothetical protein
VFNKTITCAGPKKTKIDVYIGNLWLVQYVQSYISMMCPDPNYTYSETKRMQHDCRVYYLPCNVWFHFDFSASKCQKQMDETFQYCHMWLENNAWGSRKSELPQILKDARQTIFNSPQGKSLKTMLAARANA